MPAVAFMHPAGSAVLDMLREWDQAKIDTLVLQVGDWA